MDYQSYCAICRNSFNAFCIECEFLPDQTTTCPVISGKCLHRYHDHCIKRWLKNHNVCPLDDKMWIQLIEETDQDKSNQDVIKDSKCQICLERQMEVCLLPCGHCAFCVNCANQILLNSTCCPFCRKTIEKAIKIYY